MENMDLTTILSYAAFAAVGWAIRHWGLLGGAAPVGPTPIPLPPNVSPLGGHRPLVDLLGNLAHLTPDQLAAVKSLLDHYNAPAPFGAKVE